MRSRCAWKIYGILLAEKWNCEVKKSFPCTEIRIQVSKLWKLLTRWYRKIHYHFFLPGVLLHHILSMYMYSWDIRYIICRDITLQTVSLPCPLPHTTDNLIFTHNFLFSAERHYLWKFIDPNGASFYNIPCWHIVSYWGRKANNIKNIERIGVYLFSIRDAVRRSTEYLHFCK